MRFSILVFTLMTIAAFSLAQYNFVTAPIDDATLNSAVQSKLASDKLVSDRKITISTKDGVVSLIGKVNTDEEARKAIEITESTPGIKDTDITHLVIEESKQPIADTLIIAKVNGAFAREKLFGDKDISAISIKVNSKNRIVYLTGTADSKKQVKKAIKIAKSVRGVKKVYSKIEVKSGH